VDAFSCATKRLCVDKGEQRVGVGAGFEAEQEDF
jgi:hypothetical protein